jgi:nucleotide-binding universal stress UspA family protein
MNSYRKILLATDFSDNARPALAAAVRLARRDDAQLHVVHVEVVALQGVGTFTDPPIPEYIRSISQVSMNADLVASHRDTVVRIVRDRSEAAGILRYATEQDVDLIVLGTHGRGAVGEMLMGSVAQAVAHDAAVSVMVVGRHAAEPAAQHGTVLAPVDLSQRSAAALAQAARLVPKGGRLVALNVVDFGRVAHPEELPIGERERRAGVQLGEFVEQAGLPVTPERFVTVGPAADEILRIAAKVGASLIVMAPSSHSGLERVLLGSVCKPVIRSAPCPVLVHRERAPAARERAAA